MWLGTYHSGPLQPTNLALDKGSPGIYDFYHITLGPFATYFMSITLGRANKTIKQLTGVEFLFAETSNPQSTGHQFRTLL